MTITRTPHGFLVHGLIEVRCLAGHKEGDSRKWCCIRLVGAGGKFIDVVASPRIMEIRSDHRIIEIPKSMRVNVGGGERSGA